MSKPVVEFEKVLEVRLRAGDFGAEVPLPTTRQLAEEHGLSNASAHRVLRKLAERGVLWRHENGRYYPAAARAALERPRPLVCLLRQLQTWAFAYHGVMAGVSAACGRANRSMMLTHNEFLVRHEDTALPPVFGSPEEQEAALAQFLEIHREPLHGFVLDHLWHDEVLAKFERELGRVVLVNRATTLPFASAVFPEPRLGVTLALGHLAVRGYERVVPVVPFEGDGFTERFLEEFSGVAREMGLPEEKHQWAATREERQALIARLGTDRRAALFCPEINVAALLLEELRAVGREQEVGLLAVGNASAAEQHGVTALIVPFREIGEQAVALLEESALPHSPKQVALPLALYQGATTRPTRPV